jgi:hypothetical protein
MGSHGLGTRCLKRRGSSWPPHSLVKAEVLMWSRYPHREMFAGCYTRPRVLTDGGLRERRRKMKRHKPSAGSVMHDWSLKTLLNPKWLLRPLHSADKSLWWGPHIAILLLQRCDLFADFLLRPANRSLSRWDGMKLRWPVCALLLKAMRRLALLKLRRVLFLGVNLVLDLEKSV